MQNKKIMEQGIRMSPKPSGRQTIKPAYVYAAWALGFAVVIGLAMFFYFGRFEIAFAGSTYTSTSTGGDWATGTTWTGASAPANWSSNTANLNGNITLTSTTTAINGFTAINLNGGKSFTSGTSSVANDLSMQSVTFNVVNGNIIVYGNLTLNSTTLTITTGSLTVTGTLTLTGGSTVTSNSPGAISVGSLTTSGSGGTVNLNSGSLSVTNGISISSGSTVNIASTASASAASFSSTNNSDAILNNAGLLTITGNVNEGGVINNTGTMNIGGNLVSSGSGSSVFTNSGILNVSGSVTLPSSGKLRENPGGSMVVNGSVTVGSNLNLDIGTNVSGPPYADLVIKQNLISTGSGDVLFEKNSRVAIFGNVTDSGGGGTLFTVNNGGQVYVNGNIAYSGGGSAITNNNSVSPYGLYVNGTTSNTGGGSTTTANEGNKTTMQTTDPPFYSWVASLSGSPLPVTITSFKVAEVTKSEIVLTWSTASEENFDRFVIERSSDGKSFQTIGTVRGAGNSKVVRNYSFTDEAPVTGGNYYRLKALDLDGKSDYSGVLSAEFEAQKEFGIYPNPSNGESVNFKINFDPQADDMISVTDNAGHDVMHATVSALDGKIVFAQPLQPGIYIVRYNSSSGFKKIERMVVK